MTSDLHKDPWVMARVAKTLDATRYADTEGLEAELDLLAFAEDMLARQREQIAKDIEGERDDQGRGWNDYDPEGVSQASHNILTGIKEGLSAAANVARNGYHPSWKPGAHTPRDA